MQPTHLVVGHITKPHGTKGELFVWPLTDQVSEVFAEGRALLIGDEHGQLAGEETNSLVIESSREFKRGVLVKFENLHDRSVVEPLSQRYLLAPMAELAPPGEDEVYYHQLLGLKVVTKDGQTVGSVREVYETHPAHLLEVKGEDGKLHLIPFADRIVKQVDVESGLIVIKPTPGLLEI
jgi:16S rRNA processing protein RimM